MACKLTTRMREHRRSAIMSGHSVDTSTRERMLRRDKDWIAQCDRVGCTTEEKPSDQPWRPPKSRQSIVNSEGAVMKTLHPPAIKRGGS